MLTPAINTAPSIEIDEIDVIIIVVYVGMVL